MFDNTVESAPEVTQLKAEIHRQRKIIDVLMDRAEQGMTGSTDFSLFQADVMLREQVRARTLELERALKENDRINLELSRSESRLQQLIQQSLVGICTTDGRRFLYANPKFVELTGYSLEELQGIGPLDLAVEDMRPQFDGYVQQCFSGILAGETHLIQMLKKDGSEIIADVTMSSSLDLDGASILVAVFVDITEKVCAEIKITELNKRLQEEALHDPLTGLYNRRYLEELVQRELNRIKRNNKSVSVVMSDLDYFKHINDTHGHLAGDKVLKMFGELILQNTRNSDICCRYGGEEFMLIFPDVSCQDALVCAEKLRLKLMASPVAFGEVQITMTVSSGVASFPEDADHLESLIMAADRALYRAKEMGRNRVCCANDLD